MTEPAHATVETVEQVVRRQMATALGGRRGMLETAVPTLMFTIVYLVSKDIRAALVVSLTAATLLLVLRLVQRSNPQYVVNALIGIGLGWFFIHLSKASGGDANDQVLAYFLPGLIYNSGWTLLLVLSCLVRWPVVGFMVGSVAGDVTEWRKDRQLLRLCLVLTWVLAVPGMLRLILQWPLWLAAKNGAVDEDRAIAVLAVLKIAMGWPLQLATLAVMVWLLARNHTPIEKADPA